MKEAQGQSNQPMFLAAGAGHGPERGESVCQGSGRPAAGELGAAAAESLRQQAQQLVGAFSVFKLS